MQHENEKDPSKFILDERTALIFVTQQVAGLGEQMATVSSLIYYLGSQGAEPWVGKTLQQAITEVNKMIDSCSADVSQVIDLSIG